MGTIKNEKKYTCFEDCKQFGCPGHKMEITIQTTSEVLSVYIDGRLQFSFDPSEWKTLRTMLSECDYVFFK